MVLQINFFSARVSFDFSGSQQTVSTLKSADLNESRERDERPHELSRSASGKTLVDEDSECDGVEMVDWIAGVGDVCNSTSRKNSMRSNILQSRKIDSANSPRTAGLRKATGSVKSQRSRHDPTTKRSALRRHCDFWDADQDGLIYPWDIFNGFRKLGFNIALCLWAAVSMAICSSYSTQATWLPHPLFAINLDRITANRHGSTTGAYDLDAELDMRRFDAIFNTYADGKDYLTWRTMYNVWQGQCCANDFFGWFAGGLEWIAMYILLWPQDGRMHKEDIRGVYDGSIFWEIAHVRARV